MRGGVIRIVRRSPPLYHLAKSIQSTLVVGRRLSWRARRRAVIERYLESHEVKKLELGTGALVTEGWLGSDLDPRAARDSGWAGATVIFLDAEQRFPFADGTFDYVHAEHMIEHLSYDSARSMLSECARVLRRGGRIRIATPDLSRLLALYEHREEPSFEESSYVAWIAATMLGDPRRTNPVFLLNNAFRAWGHAFLFDEATLRDVLQEAGFREVQRLRVGISEDPQLIGRERHGRAVANERANEFETMVLEGVRS
jgi:predicted SAM-dependent methyltransferase